MTVIPAKGRRAGADTVTVTRNEILTGINSSLRYSALEDEGVIVKKLMPDSLLHVLGGDP